MDKKSSGALAEFHDGEFQYQTGELPEFFGMEGISVGVVAKRLHVGFAEWAAKELASVDFDDAPDLKQLVTVGWKPLDGEEPITLFTAWAWFFRFRLKFQPEVFRIYTADVLADAAKSKRDFKAFEGWLKNEIGDIWEQLDAITTGVRVLIDQVSRMEEKIDNNQQAIMDGISTRLPEMIVGDPAALEKIDRLAEDNRGDHGITHDGLATILEMLVSLFDEMLRGGAKIGSDRCVGFLFSTEAEAARIASYLSRFQRR